MNTRCGMKKKKYTTRWLSGLLIVALILSSIVLPGSGTSVRADNLDDKTVSVENLEKESANKENLASLTDDKENLKNNITDSNNLDFKATDDENLKTRTVDNENINNNTSDNSNSEFNTENSNKQLTESYSISTFSEEGIEAYANEPPYTAENFFDASMTSTNGHYFAKGVFVNSEGDAYLLIEVEKNTNLKKILEVYIDGNKKEVSSVNRIETNTVTITLPDESQKTFTSENGFLVISIGKITNFNSGSFTLKVVTHADGGWGIDGTVTISLNYGISKEVNRTSATIGDEIIYTVTVNNAIDSDVPLFGVNVTDIVPAGLEVKKVNDSTDFSITNNIITLEENITLAIGETRTYTIIAVVSEDAVAGTITNKATMEGDFPTKSATADVIIAAKNVTVEKIITGNMSDITKEFNFTANVERSNGKYAKEYDPFKLGNGGTHKLTGLPTDGILTLSETDAGEYKTTITIIVNGEEVEKIEGASNTIYLDKYDYSDIYIRVDNNKNVIIDTGVLLDSLPYIGILVVVIVGGGIFFINKGKRKNDI